MQLIVENLPKTYLLAPHRRAPSPELPNQMEPVLPPKRPPGPPVGAQDEIFLLGNANRLATPLGHWRGHLHAAADLAEADDTLKRLEEGAGRVRQVPPGYWEQLTDIERTRDGLSTVLLDLVGSLGRGRGAALEDAGSARIRLEELVGDLKGDLALATIAARELEAALIR